MSYLYFVMMKGSIQITHIHYSFGLGTLLTIIIETATDLHIGLTAHHIAHSLDEVSWRRLPLDYSTSPHSISSTPSHILILPYPRVSCQSTTQPLIVMVMAFSFMADNPILIRIHQSYRRVRGQQCFAIFYINADVKLSCKFNVS